MPPSGAPPVHVEAARKGGLSFLKQAERWMTDSDDALLGFRGIFVLLGAGGGGGE